MVANNSGKNVTRLALPFALLVFILLLAVAAGSISRTNDLIFSHEILERRNNVLHEMDRLDESLQSAREAHLHFILTPEKEDLVNFDAAVAETWARLDRVSVMTKDDNGYPERMEQLRGLIRLEFRQFADNMRTTHTLLIFHTPDADANSNRVRAAMQKLKDDQEEILRVGDEAARTRARRVEFSISLLVGGFSVLVTALLLLVLLESRKLRIPGQFGQTQLETSLQLTQPESAAAAAAGDGKSKSS